MKLSILTKLLVIVMVLAIVPLAILGVLAITNISDMEETSSENVEDMASTAVADSTAALNALGERIVADNVELVGDQWDMYIRANPNMTIAEIQAAPEFQAISVQQVGETGYTGGPGTDGIIYFQPLTELVGLHIDVLQEPYPELYDIVNAVVSGEKEVSYGYHPFFDAEGNPVEVFTYFSLCDEVTADGVQLIAGSTNYLTEFNQPAVTLEGKLEANAASVVADISDAKDSTQQMTWVVVAIMAVIVAIVSFLFGRSVTNPIKKLTKAAEKVSIGDMNVKIDVKSKDEIGDLADSFGRMVASMKFMMEDDEPVPSADSDFDRKMETALQ